ncbi:exonuclease [Stutzerimonas nosocomialis]|uniref:Exonuclease n=1 Tax=Stutzerimonas nosocomialis TaxID=1056496 RepID=A0A5R9QIB5_9GAMM|nr:exonuclease domain-containing protein [Stutzerimonas nosocomialis]TLX57204.1 exonuclease [Stutzerimonas nosocomialis]TLX59255.1 exonuclease [Stutzerimonas nosocomialis]TLX64653.1 exonuclease [Stutzerimonas nosocomialis]
MKLWLVIDLEATTEEGGWPLKEMEVIEIGASLVDENGRETDHFQRFVKPVRRPLLTAFCQELTHITQAQVDSAQSFPVVWSAFERWLKANFTHLCGWTSWGDYDRLQLQQEWTQHGLHSALNGTMHLNLKQCFARVRQLHRPVGLQAALQLAGYQFSGQQHRALEDARNTARLLPLVLPMAAHTPAEGLPPIEPPGGINNPH